MQAPEKIYLDIEPNLDDCTWHLTNPNGDSAEYILTDAFIEKVCEWLKKEVEEDYVLCENLIKDFKNYMKG